uniref:Uncharacterized protein n=1 Tax=Anguilla anguilla TaxID=7936 RepID=A0A0E9QS47_ANGAN
MGEGGSGGGGGGSYKIWEKTDRKTLFSKLLLHSTSKAGRRRWRVGYLCAGLQSGSPVLSCLVPPDRLILPGIRL